VLGREFRRSGLVGVALNVGNDSNYDKMIKGSKKDISGSQEWTEEGVDEALAHLMAEEWNFVQEIWDTFEETYPAVKEVYRRENGVEPERVEAREIETKHGQVLRGGYFPMMYDPSRSTQAADIEGKSALEAMESAAVQAGVFSGMTKQRNAGFSAPVKLDLTALPMHLERTAHFVTHYEPVRIVRKLLNRRDVKGAITNKLGSEYYEVVKSWMGDVAANGQRVERGDVVGSIVESMRRNATVGIMGFSYTTMASQLLGYANSVDALSKQSDGSYSPRKAAYWLGVGLAEYAKNPSKAVDTVFEASGEMRHRLQNIDREMRHVLQTTAGKTGAIKGSWAKMQRSSLMGIGYVQLYLVDLPLWIGAYNQVISEGFDQRGAVTRADSMVRMAQTAGGIKDLAAVQRKRGVQSGLFMFYSYFSLLYNMIAETAGGIKRPKDVPRAVARLMLLLALPTAAEALMRQEGPDEDDENYAEWLALKTFFYGFSSVPLLRDMVGMAEGFGYSISPIDSLGESLGKAVRGLAKAYDEGEMDLATLKAMVGSVGFLFGAPVSMPNRILSAATADDATPYDFLIGYRDD